jgi:hypothetical protein
MKSLITFSAGSQDYHDASNRLQKQANEIELFDNIIGYTDEDLKNDNIFWEKHSNFITNNKRGYGYWIWKSYIIKKTMDKMNDGDVLLYVDCGCEINIRKKEILKHYFEVIKNEYIIGCLTELEKEWNKMDLIIKLDMNYDEYLNSRQCEAGAVLIFVCDKTRCLVNEWYELACDYHNIDDTPSLHKNLDCFIEHRHDQSIFSLLRKKYNFVNKYSMYNCLEYHRNRSGISVINR